MRFRRFQRIPTRCRETILPIDSTRECHKFEGYGVYLSSVYVKEKVFLRNYHCGPCRLTTLRCGESPQPRPCLHLGEPLRSLPCLRHPVFSDRSLESLANRSPCQLARNTTILCQASSKMLSGTSLPYSKNRKHMQ